MNLPLILAAVFASMPVLALLGVHKVWPVILTHKLPPGVQGNTRFGLFIFIRNDNHWHDSAGHEREHIRQRLMLFLIGHIILYKTNRDYRLWAEKRAYAVSVLNGLDIDEAARRLAGPHYDLGITQEQAKQLIQSVKL